jgi:uncharacterized repeat protein (TIGR03803 family)
VIRIAIFVTAVWAGWIGTWVARGQSVTSIYTFNANGIAGMNPVARLVVGPDGQLYGSTAGGGNLGYGTIFKVTTNGGFTTLVNFNNANGADPQAALTPGTDGNFYGTTYLGGGFGDGTVFRMGSNGAVATLVNFSGINGVNPHAGLVQGTNGNF